MQSVRVDHLTLHNKRIYHRLRKSTQSSRSSICKQTLIALKCCQETKFITLVYLFPLDSWSPYNSRVATGNIREIRLQRTITTCLSRPNEQNI